MNYRLRRWAIFHIHQCVIIVQKRAPFVHTWYVFMRDENLYGWCCDEDHIQRGL